MARDEWYTPTEILEYVRRCLGSIELDPASCVVANENVRAERYYTASEDGLIRSWHAETLFLNPPYSKVEPWVAKLHHAYQDGQVKEAIAVLNASPGTNYWYRYVRQYVVCFYRGRIAFIDPDGVPQENSNTENAIVYYGENSEKFIRVFAAIGSIYAPIVDKKVFSQGFLEVE